MAEDEFNNNGKPSNSEENPAMDMDFLKFDKRVFVITLIRRIPIAILMAILFGVLTAVALKYVAKSEWKAACALYRRPRNNTVKSEMPLLFGRTKLKTIVRTIKKHENLSKLKTKLGLDYSERDISRMIDVSSDRNGIITIVVTAPKQDLPDKIANTLCEVFLDSYISEQNAEARNIYTHYLEDTSKLSEKIRLLKKKAEQFLEKNNVMSIDSEINLKFQQLNDLELQLINNRMSLNKLQSKLKNMTKALGKMKGDTLQSYVVADSSQSNIHELEAQYESLKQKFTDENPKVKSVLEQIAAYKKMAEDAGNHNPEVTQKTFGPNGVKITFEVEKLKTEIEIKSLSNNLKRLEDSIATIKRRIETLVKLKNPYLEIQREISLKRDLLNKLEGVVAEAKILMTSKVCDFAVLERAVKSKFPEPTKKKLIVAASIVVGFAGAVVLSLLLEFIDFSIKSKSDIETVLSIKPIGNLPDKDAVSKIEFYSAFQIFINNLSSHLTSEKRPSLCLFVSDRCESGKSFIIERSIAFLEQQNKKILYIDTISEGSGQWDAELEGRLINPLLFDPKSNAENVAFGVVSDNLKNGYFLFNDEAFSKIVDSASMEAFLSSLSEFDVVFWELFDIQQNIQLFATIAGASRLTVFVARFRSSNRGVMKSAINFLKDRNIFNIVGVLNYVDRKYYKNEI